MTLDTGSGVSTTGTAHHMTSQTYILYEDRIKLTIKYCTHTCDTTQK